MDKIKVGLQYWIPQHGLTRLVGKLASAKAGGLTTAIIRWFIKQYNVNMDEALHIVRKGMVDHPLSADPEICFSSTLTKLMNL